MFDSHCHIQFLTYDADRDAVIRRARAAGVKMIAVGTQFSTSQGAIALAEKYPGEVWATVGHHPSHVIVGRSDQSIGTTDGWHHDHKEQRDAVPEEFDVEAFRRLAKHPKAVAIGECGLDYFRLSQNSNFKSQIDGQKKVFLAQAEIAKEVGKPLMIHCRPSKGTDDAYEDLLSLVPSFQLLVPRIVHFYVGSPVMSKKL